MLILCDKRLGHKQRNFLHQTFYLIIINIFVVVVLIDMAAGTATGTRTATVDTGEEEGQLMFCDSLQFEEHCACRFHPG